MEKIINIHINNLLVDVNNYRLESSESQEQAIESMFLKQGDKLFNLAKDICENGLSPEKNILVMPSKENGLYIVKEGNRRITSIKILKDINKYLFLNDKNSKLYSKFKKISQMPNNTPDNIRCCVENDINRLNIIIERIHTGENEGVGTSPWDTEAKERFNLQSGKKTTLGFKVIEYYRNNVGELDSNQITTTTSRILSSQVAKNFFGLQTKGDELTFYGSSELFHKKLTHLFALLQNKTINSRNANNTKQIEDIIYKHFSQFDTAIKDNKPTKLMENISTKKDTTDIKTKFNKEVNDELLTKAPLHNPPNNNSNSNLDCKNTNYNTSITPYNINQLNAIVEKNTNSKVQKTIVKGRKFFYEGIVLETTNPTYTCSKKVLSELQNLKLDTTLTFAASSLTRTLLESLLHHYYVILKDNSNYDYAISKLVEIYKDQNIFKKNQGLSSVIKILEGHIEYLNSTCHGKYIEATSDKNKEIENDTFPLVNYIINHLNENSKQTMAK